MYVLYRGLYFILLLISSLSINNIFYGPTGNLIAEKTNNCRKYTTDNSTIAEYLCNQTSVKNLDISIIQLQIFYWIWVFDMTNALLSVLTPWDPILSLKGTIPVGVLKQLLNLFQYKHKYVYCFSSYFFSIKGLKYIKKITLIKLTFLDTS